MEDTEHESSDGSYRFFDEQEMFDALDHGTPPLPAVLPAGSAAIAAVGQWGRYGSLTVVLRDPEDGELYSDVYLLTRSAAGQWQYPSGSSGGGMPEWVLHRPDAPLPDWHGNNLVNLSSQLARPDTEWVTELTVMATRRIAAVQVHYADDVIDLSVPASGLVTVPHAIRHVDDRAEFRGFDDSGELIAVAHYQPLTDDDRRCNWPDASVWTD
ncbi:hypothetical protein HS041_30875 [Planomonospora sp. ID67723]|uniref:hypothetical protein n=1 Tax=Planomonospora sp. ID67723 TaxID=2738134 RepID=UPI0018C446BC|nr:hypothetical protein [Planomonospora sp. ID67723]MBG0832112.1 hypothetical protein [Planomonospora sp. ID67723]